MLTSTERHLLQGICNETYATHCYSEMAFPTWSPRRGKRTSVSAQQTPMQLNVLNHFGDIEIQCKKCSLSLSHVMRSQGDEFVLACPACGGALCHRMDNKIVFYICRFCAKKERDLSDLNRHECAVHLFATFAKKHL